MLNFTAWFPPAMVSFRLASGATATNGGAEHRGQDSTDLLEVGVLPNFHLQCHTFNYNDGVKASLLNGATVLAVG